MGRALVPRKMRMVIETDYSSLPYEHFRRKGDVKLLVRRFGNIFDEVGIERVEARLVRKRRIGECELK